MKPKYNIRLFKTGKIIKVTEMKAVKLIIKQRGELEYE